MNNNIDLSIYGYQGYYLTKSGKVFTNNNVEIKADTTNKFYLTKTNGIKERISLKKLYRIVFDTEFSVDNIENLLGEEWKEIKNTNGKYLVSSYGRIKSRCGYIAIILQQYLQKSGYLEVKINNKNVKIHQLVASAFCENKYNGIKVEIHHRNKNRTDNRAENLQILSIAEHHKLHNEKETADNEL